MWRVEVGQTEGRVGKCLNCALMCMPCSATPRFEIISADYIVTNNEDVYLLEFNTGRVCFASSSSCFATLPFY